MAPIDNPPSRQTLGSTETTNGEKHAVLWTLRRGT
jgi:hypothetical protein